MASTLPQATKSPRKAMDHQAKYQAALDRTETALRYWIFLSPDGLVWTKASGQAAAREAAGVTSVGFALHYATAGECLRVCEMQAASRKVDIVDLADLVLAANADPEPESGASLLHAKRKAQK